MLCIMGFTELLHGTKVEDNTVTMANHFPGSGVLHPGDWKIVEGSVTSDREPTDWSEIDWFTLSVQRG